MLTNIYFPKLLYEISICNPPEGCIDTKSENNKDTFKDNSIKYLNISYI